MGAGERGKKEVHSSGREELTRRTVLVAANQGCFLVSEVDLFRGLIGQALRPFIQVSLSVSFISRIKLCYL